MNPLPRMKKTDPMLVNHCRADAEEDRPASKNEKFQPYESDKKDE